MLSKAGGNAEVFLAYVKNEVVPFIESNYRTLPERTAIGHSLGASFLIYTMVNFTRGTWESQLWIKEAEWFSNKNRIIRPENGAVYLYEVDSYSYSN